MTRSFRSHVLREYALVADGQRGALIGPDGTIDWLCAPRWDSPAVFRQLQGNLPQAFVHAGLLETAARMSARS